MTNEVAGLAIKIDSTDATKAAENLDKVTAAGEKTEGAAKKVQRSWEQAIERVAAEASGLNGKFDTLNSTQSRMLAAVERVAAQMDKMSAAMDRAASQTTAATQAADRNAASISKVEKEAQRAAVSFSQLEARTKESGSAALANLNTMTRFEQTLGKTAAQSNTVTQAAIKTTDSLNSADRGARAAATGMGAAASGASGMGAAFSVASGYIKLAVAALAGFSATGLVKESTMLAARFETMGIVMNVAGNNAGYTRAEMAGLELQMQKTGISMIGSREVLTNLATANIDLADATKLARAAQDLAVVGNINSTEALSRMVAGIKSGEVEVLRTLGLNVSFERSYDKLANTLGVSREALTEQQKTLARSNSVLDESTRYTGIYEESMTAAGKAMGSMARLWEDFKVKAGDSFLPTLAAAVANLTEALKLANAELATAGSEQTIDSIGSGLAAAFKTVYQTVVVLGANVAYVFASIGREIAGIVKQAGALATLDFEGAGKIREAMVAEAEASRKAIDAFENRIMGIGVASAAAVAATEVSESVRIAAGEASRKLAEQEAARANWGKIIEQNMSKQAKLAQDIANIEATGVAAGKSRAEIEQQIANLRAKAAGSGAANPFAALGLSSIENELKRQVAAIEASTGALETVYQRGDMSTRTYYTQRIALAEQSAAAQESAIQREIQALAGLNASGKNGQQVRERLAAAETKLVIARAKNSSEVAALREQEAAYFRGPSTTNIRVIEDQERALLEQNRAVQEQIDFFGRTASEMELLRVARVDATIAQQQAILVMAEEKGAAADEIRAIQERIKALNGLREARQASAGLMATHEDQQKAQERINANVQQWSRGIDKIGDLFIEGFSASLDENENAFDAFVDNAGKSLKNALATAFYEATVRPVVVKFVAQMAGMLGGQGVADGILKQAGLGGNNAFGMAQQGLSLYNNASTAWNTVSGWLGLGGSAAAAGMGTAGAAAGLGLTGSMLGTGAGAMTGAGLGLSAGASGLGLSAGGLTLGGTAGTSAAVAGGGAAAGGAGLMGTIGAAAPWIAGAALAYSLLADKFKGETRFGAGYTIDPSTGLANRSGGPSGGDQNSKASADAIGAMWSTTNQLAGLMGGSTAGLGFAGGLEISPEKGNSFVWSDWVQEGEANDYKRGMRSLSGVKDGETVAAEFAIELNRAVIDGLKLSSLDKEFADYLGRIDTDALDAAGVEAVLANLNAMVQFRDVLTRLPFADLAGLALEAGLKMAEYSGGMEPLLANMQTYYDLVYSEQEKAEHLQVKLVDSFRALGYELPDSVAGLRSLTEGLDTTTDAGMKARAEIYALTGSFGQLQAMLANLGGTVVDVVAEANAAFEAQLAKVKSLADEANRLLGARNAAGNVLDQIDRAMGRTGQFALQRESELWAAMATASYEQQIGLASELTSITLERYQQEIAAAEQLRDLGKGLRDYVSGLKISDMSPLTLGERLAEAGNQYADMLAKAQGGDTDAMSGLTGMASSYLDLARQYYASSDQYTQIFDGVTGGLDALGVQAQSDAERQIAIGTDSLAQLEQLRDVAEGAYAALDRQYQQSLGALAQEASLLTSLGQDTGRLHDIASLLGSMPAELAARLQPMQDAATGSTVSGWYQDTGRGAGDAQGVDYWQGQLGSRPADQVQGDFNWALAADWYRAELGREAQAEEIAWWAEEIKKRGTASAYQDFLWSAQREIDGSHATGLWNVPKDGYIAELHRNETVLPAPEARRYRALESMPNWQDYGRGDSRQMDAVVAQLKVVTEELKQLRAERNQGDDKVAGTVANGAVHVATAVAEAASLAKHEADISA